MSKYISLENLERYDAKMQERAASFCASKQDGMWRQTEKAGSVQFWPVGNSPLEGTVEFMFKETGPASGTKSPDNPSTISGVSSISLTVCQEEGVDEHSYTLSLGGTYYGGSIDLATGLMTVTWDAAKFTGNEVWELTSESNETSSVFQSNLGLPNMTMSSTQNASTRCCSHFPYSGSSSVPYRFMTWGNTTRVYFVGPASVFPDANSFKAFLASEYAAGHPVVLVYLKAAPQTVQLTPPQILSLVQPDKYVPRLNTVYTDADAVQIVYQKNPVRDKFEKVQAIIAQGGNV